MQKMDKNIGFCIRIGGSNVSTSTAESISSKLGWRLMEMNLAGSLLSKCEKRYITVSKYDLTEPFAMGIQPTK